jgi:phenylpropionate dioxygenase-like ring-hydroxylating dioxygenase large terminal subunit
MFLNEVWYFGMRSAALKPGDLVRREMVGQPILFARAKDGRPFAFQDICPHRGVPLSAGKLYDQNDRVGGETITEPQVECPYHGWRFGVDGGCRKIPSLLDDQNVGIDKIRVPTYPVEEKNGVIWVYVPAPRKGPLVEEVTPKMPAPELPAVEPDWQPRFRMEMDFNCHVDHAVIGLMDPAHVPFVHRQWWWRTEKSMYDKSKEFGPKPFGFSMLPHEPSSNSFAYRWIFGARPETEIVFRLPGIRTELIKSARATVLGLTCVTPINERLTEITQLFYWNAPFLSFLTPLLRPFAKTFLAQDGDMVDLQQEGLKYEPRLMLINDTDVQAKWYFRLKEEYQAAMDEGRAFENPVKPATLRWRS